MLRQTVGCLGLALLLLAVVGQELPTRNARADEETKSVEPPKTELPPSKEESKPAESEKVDPRTKFLTPQTLFINQQIAEGWKAADIKKPAGRSTDLEFQRRVFIDLIGRIPTYEETVDFEQDSAADKRGRLVRRLLYGSDSGAEAKPYHPKNQGSKVTITNAKGKKEDLTFDYPDEYARHWAQTWTIWLMSRTGDSRYRDQMQVWLQLEFMKNSSHKEITNGLLTATGKSNQNGAVNFIAHHVGDLLPPEKRGKYGKFDAVPITSRVTKLFLGLQTQCTQCHDHPKNPEWVQSDFWGVNSFFRQVDLVADDGTTVRPTTPMNRNNAALMQYKLVDVEKSNEDAVVLYERRDGKLMASKANFLKDYADAEKKTPPVKGLESLRDVKSRREALSHYVISHDNYARAYVNRTWGYLFGRGLNKETAFDDFGSHNEIVHPALLDRLAADFVKYNYDSKKLLEWICTSDVYQLSHIANKEYADPKFDPYFARMPLKAMAPEVLFESLVVATRGGVGPTSEEKKKSREDWMGKLVRNFGDDEGNEQVFNGTIVQALLMMNGPELNRELSAKGTNVVQKICEKHSRGGSVNIDGIIDEIFMTTVNRHATSEEKANLRKIQSVGAKLKVDPATKETKPAPAPPKSDKPRPPRSPQEMTPPSNGIVPPSSPSDVAFYQDLFWAMLNSSEFILNH